MYLTDEQALDLAFELFMTLAPDNLSEQEMNLFNQQFNEVGFVELFDLDQSTLDNLDISIDIMDENELEENQQQLSNLLVEVIIGANPTHTQTPIIFAKVILSIHPQKKFSHIQWMSDLL